MFKKIIGLSLILLALATTTEGTCGSVICIHGFLRTYRCMRPMGRSLQKCGFDVCLWDYPSRKRSIQGHARNLLCILKAKASEKPGEPIHFVCHSLGALILRATLNMPGCPEEAKIGRAVLLAPPNRGSSFGQSVKDVLPAKWILGSGTGHQLINFDECDIIRCLGNYPSTMDVMVIAGCKGNQFLFNKPNDGILTVEETYLNTPHYFYVLNEGHGKLITSCDTIMLTRHFLLSYKSCCDKTSCP
ncbi:MAG: alpha/beta hydrolase [Chlamydiia bacterium]|nr:alpha/beta hydrolase [Chlamydiia bacterium]